MYVKIHPGCRIYKLMIFKIAFESDGKNSFQKKDKLNWIHINIVQFQEDHNTWNLSPDWLWSKIFQCLINPRFQYNSNKCQSKLFISYYSHLQSFMFSSFHKYHWSCVILTMYLNFWNNIVWQCIPIFVCTTIL